MGLTAGGLAAAAPLLVEYAGMARPYALAWSFGILGVYWASLGGGRRWLLSGILAGLAVGTRLEMLLLLPYVLGEAWAGSGREQRWRIAARLTSGRRGHGPVGLPLADDQPRSAASAPW